MIGSKHFPLMSTSSSMGLELNQEQKENGVNQTAVYKDLKLHFMQNVGAKLDCDTLARVIPDGIGIRFSIIDATNCCWVNVWITTLAKMGIRLSLDDATDLMCRIETAGSQMMSPLDTGDLVSSVKLPVTLVEYSLLDQVGWSIGTPNGPLVVFVNTGAHYQIWLPVESDLNQLFSTVYKLPRKTVRNSRPLTEYLDVDQVMKRAITDSLEIETRRLAQLELVSAERFGIDQMERAIAESLEIETNRLAQLELDHARRFDADAHMAQMLSERPIANSLETETRRLAQLELDHARRFDADAHMAQMLSTQLNYF